MPFSSVYTGKWDFRRLIGVSPQRSDMGHKHERLRQHYD